MRLRHRVPLLAIVAAGAILPATAVAADAAAAPPATAAVEKPLLTVTGGLSIDLLGLKIVLGAPPRPAPTVPGDPALLALSLAADVGLNAGPLSAQIDAAAGATVSQNLGAAVTVDANVNVPGVLDTGLALDATVPPPNSGTPASGSLHIKGLDGSTTPASGSTGAAPPKLRPGGAIAGSQTTTPPVTALPVTSVRNPPTVAPRGNGAGHPTTKPSHPVRSHPRTPAADGRLTSNLAPALRKPAALPPLEATDLPVSSEVIDAVVATGRTLALPLALLAALLAYLGLQRLLDRGPKLAWANGRTPPDDELLEL